MSSMQSLSHKVPMLTPISKTEAFEIKIISLIAACFTWSDFEAVNVQVNQQGNKSHWGRVEGGRGRTVATVFICGLYRVLHWNELQGFLLNKTTVECSDSEDVAVKIVWPKPSSQPTTTTTTTTTEMSEMLWRTLMLQSSWLISTIVSMFQIRTLTETLKLYLTSSPKSESSCWTALDSEVWLENPIRPINI